MPDQSPPEFLRLTLRPLVSEVPVTQRLKKLLKFALRQCQLRCVGWDWPEEGRTMRAVDPNQEEES